MANISEDKLDRVLEHMDTLHKGIDDIKEDHKKLATRMDAFEGEREKEKTDAKTRADAEEKERKEKKIADAAARHRVDEDKEERGKFAEAQMRADAAYQALRSEQAPHALHGETLNDFRVRLMKTLKPHSKVYKDSDLGILVQDAASFSLVEDAIIADAIEASNAPGPVGSPLREVVTKNDTGHIFRKFIGDAGVTWAPFMGGATKFGRIVRPHSR